MRTTNILHKTTYYVQTLPQKTTECATQNYTKLYTDKTMYTCNTHKLSNYIYISYTKSQHTGMATYNLHMKL